MAKQPTSGPPIPSPPAEAGEESQPTMPEQASEPAISEPAIDPTAKPKAKKPVKKRQKRQEKLSAYEESPGMKIDVRMPFRPSHLSAMIREYQEAHDLDDDDDRLDPFRFTQEFGLPKARKRIAVQGTTSDSVDLEIQEFEAVDESEAISQYAAEHIPATEVHKTRFRTVVHEQ